MLHLKRGIGVLLLIIETLCLTIYLYSHSTLYEFLPWYTGDGLSYGWVAIYTFSIQIILFIAMVIFLEESTKVKYRMVLLPVVVFFMILSLDKISNNLYFHAIGIVFGVIFVYWVVSCFKYLRWIMGE